MDKDRPAKAFPPVRVSEYIQGTWEPWGHGELSFENVPPGLVGKAVNP